MKTTAENKKQKCSYGCGKDAEYIFQNGRACCSSKAIQCPAVKKKSITKPNGKSLTKYKRVKNFLGGFVNIPVYG